MKVAVGLFSLWAVAGFLALLLYGCPQYSVWQQGMEGKAELSKAEFNRQIKIQEAHAQLEAAKHLANAEVERARGVAEANTIIGQSLKGNEAYLRYLWIHNLETGQGERIYIPTEAGLPILEARARK
jgi:hypothetical protein